MPAWLQYLIWAAAAAAASATLWKNVLRPLRRLVKQLETTIPLLVDLTAELKDQPGAFAILKEIVKQFRTDSGSSLLDKINRLDDAAREARAAAEVLKAKVEAAKLLDAEDRAAAVLLKVALDKVVANVAELVAAAGRTQ